MTIIMMSKRFLHRFSILSPFFYCWLVWPRKKDGDRRCDRSRTFSAARFQDGGLFWTILLNLFLLLEKLEVAAVWYLYAGEQQWDQHEFMNKFCFCQSQKSKCSYYLLVELGLSICLQTTWQITEKLTFWLVATIVLLLPEVKLETIQFTWYGFSFSCSFSGCRL